MLFSTLAAAVTTSASTVLVLKRERDMRLGMMQPYFFPYLGYYALIAATDRWVVFDTPQYIRRGWVNRNRVLSTGADGWKYIRIPTVHADRHASIREIRIDDSQDWRDKLVRDLDFYEVCRAPWFDETLEFLTGVLQHEEDNLGDWLIHCLQQTCEYLELPIDLERFSRFETTMRPIHHPGHWALEMARTIDADTYINPPGGRELFDGDEFERSGVKLQFLTHRLPEYSQRQSRFISGLSIIDVLMWNGRRQARRMINEYDLDSNVSYLRAKR